MIYEKDKLIFASGRFVRMLEEGETFAATTGPELREGAVVTHPDREPSFMFERYGRLFQTRLALFGLPMQNEDLLWLSYAFAVPRAYLPFRLRPQSLDRWIEPSIYEIDEIQITDRHGPVKVTRRFYQFEDRTYEQSYNRDGKPSGWRLVVGLEPRRGYWRRRRAWEAKQKEAA